MLVKGMASGNLVETHIMVKIYWFLDLVFGKGPAQSIITLLNGPLNAGMGLRRATGIFFGLASPPFDKCDKSCKMPQHIAEFGANRNVQIS